MAVSRRLALSTASSTALAMLLLGCGGSSQSHRSSASPSPSASVSSGSSATPATGGGAGGSGSGGGAPGGGGGSGGGAPGGGSTSSGSLAVAVSAAPACVAPGAKESVTIKAKPGAPVAFTTTYSSGEPAASPGFGGSDSGVTDASGSWTSTWTVDATAPAGQARVDAVGASGDTSGTATAYFSVVGPTGKC